MNYKRLLNTKVGIIFISMMLGLGLAVLFRSACNGKDCIDFKGPSFNDIDGKTYQFGDSCYKYHAMSSSCDSNKQILEFSNPKTKEGLEPSVAPPSFAPPSFAPPSFAPPSFAPPSVTESVTQYVSTKSVTNSPSKGPESTIDSFFSTLQNFWDSLTHYFYYTLD